ncbi:hypothetical protein HPB47_014417 [Ixodes persulcatus]|uniref:Uncharacterized protein n=1 Tax=Ixodes persulcatus TaxID=34615 RepID=A0AC60QZN7_IXOPE|nr:hypothetical protein HPB47_014417 [Ixodes persulcatus]
MLGKSKGGNTAPNMALAQGKEIRQILDEIGDPGPQNLGTRRIESRRVYEADFTMWEIEAAIERGNEWSAGGPDGITNTMLKNLPEEVKRNLLKSINDAWHEGSIPDKWKPSWACPIPKPGKTPDCASNVHPIGLTSILSKLMERMVLARINWIIEHKREVLHPAQTGFRKNLGTQDSLVLIHVYLVNRPTHCHRQLLVAVGIKKNFDTLPHPTVIDTARKLGVWGSPLNFTKAFQSGRKYLVKTGKHCSSEEKTNEIGVPQGAVLSPVFFNLAMALLLWRLAVVPDLTFTVYAEDITAWTMGSNNAPLPETTIQRALDKGLSFVRCLATRAVGLGERLAKTVVQASLIPKISYGLGFYKLNATQRSQLETLINDARRCISGLPKCTHLDLLHEARNQERTYGAKLAHTRQGGALSDLMPPWSSLCAQTAQSPIADPIPPWQTTTVTPACPIPRRVNSTTNAGIRRKFARRLEKSGGDDELRLYVDAAFKDGVAITAAWHYEHVTKGKKLQHCGSAQEAEVNAVLEAMKDTAVSSSNAFHKLRFFTDSQTTMRALRTEVKAHDAVGEIFRLHINWNDATRTRSP